MSKYFHYILQINHSLYKHKSSITEVSQDTKFGSVAGNKLQESSVSDAWQGFEFTFVIINDFRKKDSS